MEKESKRDIQIKIERFHFSVRLKSFFFPLQLAELTPILSEIGYSMRKELAERIPDLPLGGRIVVGGSIAEKKDTGQTFRLEPDRGVIAIAGHDINGVIEDFSRFEKLVRDKVNVNLEAEASFYEFIAEGSATTGKDPTKVIAKLFKDSNLESQISKILGFSAANFGVRIVEQNRYVTEAQWFDLKIEPFVPKPTVVYDVNLTCRHPKRANAVDTAKSLSKTVENILAVMEREA
jgi:hypothetical protein